MKKEAGEMKKAHLFAGLDADSSTSYSHGRSPDTA